MDQISIALITLLVVVIGALPFGLVNLSVMDAAYHIGKRPALRLAHGASWVEVLYSISALLAGSVISNAIDNSRFVKYLAILIPLIIGLVFMLRKTKIKAISSNNKQGFLKGIVLNLLSVQLLLYWVIAATWLKTSYLTELNPGLIIIFVISVWVGKMGVLWMYAHYSQFILSKSDFLARNINRVIGMVLILSGLIQLIK